MKRAGKLHFLGIAGHAMFGVAVAARDLGYEVTGTDETAYPPGSDRLDEAGFTWWREAAAEHLDGADSLIISGGTLPDHVEVLAARERGVAIKSFAEFVGDLAAEKHRIVVAGTHGKTTTSSLIAWLLESAGKHPDFLIGIKPHNFENSVRLSDSNIMVFEGDEYTSSQVDRQPKFHYYRPDTLVCTSLEMDHPDIYENVEQIENEFAKLMSSMSHNGRIIYCAESKRLEKLASKTEAKIESYGNTESAWQSENISYSAKGLHYSLMYNSQHLGDVSVPLFGDHNVLNSLAAIAALWHEKIDFADLQKGLTTFKGAARRFEKVSAEKSDICIIDDYAHHPTEVAATLLAARKHLGGRIIAVFRPHTYSRTKELLADYHQSFGDADVTFVTGIEGAREAHLAATVSGADIVKELKNAEYIEDRSTLVERIVETAKPGDSIICMTVNGYDNLVKELNDRLN